MTKPSLEDRGWFETKADLQAGAPYFVAPEQLRGDRPSIRSDIYSFGLIIDEMVTTSRAYSSDSLHALYYQKLWEEPLPPSQRREDLPQFWEKTILSCLQQKPDKRPPRAGQVVSELRSGPSATGEGSEPRANGRILTFVRSLWPQSVSRRRALIAALTFPVLAGLSELAIVAAHPPSTSVGVYQIANLTGRTEYDYLCKGTTMELTRQLSRVRDIRVIPMYEPRTAGSRRPPEAHFTFEGHLQGESSRMRLSFQLTDQTGAIVWSEKFDRSLGDTLEMQLEVANDAIQAGCAAGRFFERGHRFELGGGFDGAAILRAGQNVFDRF